MHYFNRIIIIVIVGFTVLAGCSEAQTDSTHQAHELKNGPLPVVPKDVQTPNELENGEGLFNNNCARCHGPQGSGTTQGPPLVHKIYEPSHHADFAFQRAAAQGVRAHHWKFGNMPKIEGIAQEEVAEIIRYVRWLQQQAGIF